MSQHLYDEVTAHNPHALTGTDGFIGSASSSSSQINTMKKRKAYACTNCMEFFAETSVAFLATSKLLRECALETYESFSDPSGSTFKYPLEEYNKWFPHNSDQLKQHDPYTYNVLSRMWK